MQFWGLVSGQTWCIDTRCPNFRLRGPLARKSAADLFRGKLNTTKRAKSTRMRSAKSGLGFQWSDKVGRKDVFFHFEATFWSPDSAGATAPYSPAGAHQFAQGRSEMVALQQYIPRIDKLWPSLILLFKF